MTLTFTVKLSLSFANEIGAQRVAPWPPARWCEENRNAPGFLVMSRTMGRIGYTAAALFTKVPDDKGGVRCPSAIIASS